MRIRPAEEADFEQIWPIFHQVVSRGDTYTFSPKTTQEEARKWWLEIPLETYVVEADREILGTYYIKPNGIGPASHICNSGFMVAEASRGKGIGRLMGEHALQTARELGFKAMQFNSVVSTNQRAVQLWQKLGFEIVGTIPKGFQHQTLGLVDIFIMYQWLGAIE
ncbi:MAG: GNAT family N-acetyltransferase [Microcoleaceae cyanobacterium]